MWRFLKCNEAAFWSYQYSRVYAFVDFRDFLFPSFPCRIRHLYNGGRKAKLVIMLNYLNTTMKTYGRIDAYSRLIHIGRDWPAWLPVLFAPWERAPFTPEIGGWVGLRAGLDDMEKWKFLALPGLELRPLSCPTPNHSLYWLRYRASLQWGIESSEALSLQRLSIF
jgi:hypothetical protein